MGEYIASGRIPQVILTPSTEDLSCHRITTRALCSGSLQIATIPQGADIYIYEESQPGYVQRTEITGSMSNPAIIDNIECTSPTRSNKFKLSYPGYCDVEGILDITQGTTYTLYIIMEPYAPVPEFGGGFLIPALAMAAIIVLLLGRKKREDKHKYEYHKLRVIEQE